MRILVHDYPGHAFPLQLSRWLAAQGHTVRHCWSADIESPHGDLALNPADSGSFSLLPLGTGRPLAKYSLVRRLWAETRYSRQLSRAIAQFQPDTILCNAPPSVLKNLQKPAKARLVFWVQDFYAPALAERLGTLGKVLKTKLTRLESRILARADGLILIAATFAENLVQQGLPAQHLHVIPNWPLRANLIPGTKNNLWAKRYQLARKFVFLYTGTLGLKHNPKLLLNLAQAVQSLSNSPQVVVVTQGPGRSFLEKAKQQHNLNNLVLLDYQSQRDFPNVLATADVLLSLLEPTASSFSVPSKILSYLCAARPQLAAIPASNPAAKLLTQAGGGKVVEPANTTAFIQAALELHANPSLCHKLGHAGRAYAEKAFDIDEIGRQFLTILSPVKHD